MDKEKECVGWVDLEIDDDDEHHWRGAPPRRMTSEKRFRRDANKHSIPSGKAR